MEEGLIKGLEGKFDEPPATKKIRMGLTEVLRKVGRATIRGAAIAGATVTAPLWFPFWFTKKAAEEANAGALAVILSAVYYAGGLIGGLYALENKVYEPETRAAIVKFAENAPNTHLAFIIYYDKLKLVRMSQIFGESPETTEFVITGAPVTDVLGMGNGKYSYAGIEKRQGEKGELSFPQFSANL